MAWSIRLGAFGSERWTIMRRQGAALSIAADGRLKRTGIDGIAITNGLESRRTVAFSISSTR
jgi:hypothetical protein